MTRVVLLGASNIAIGFPLIVRQLASGLSGPLTLFAAFGHGRSYCGWSRVLARSLPSIDACGLWHDLRGNGAGGARTLAVITDVGNDLIYGVPPHQVAARVENCLARLGDHQAEVVATRLPLASVERLSALRFQMTKTIFFPRTKGSWPAMRAHARELDDRLGELAAGYPVRLIDQPLDWYGFDPIHIRRGHRARAWQTIFGGWPSFRANGQNGRVSLRQNLRLRLASPAERRLFGRPRRRAQPAVMHDEMAIHLY